MAKAKTVGAVVLTTLAAMIAGAYFFGGSDAEAKKRRRLVRGWAMRAKADVLESIERLSNVDKQTYLDAVAAVMKRYEAMKDIDAKELAALGKELRGYWNEVKATTIAAPAPEKKKARKTATRR
ncbi:hypothetical protein EBS80_05175 [bacterium]|nr:hypothetical protein [bacterium]